MDEGFKLKHENPKGKANILSKIFFGWMIKVVYKGTKNGLELNDLYKAMDKDKSEGLGDRLEKNWNNEILRANKKNTKPSLLRAMFKTFCFEFMLYGIFAFVLHCVLWCSQPLVLSHLISLFSDPYHELKQKEMYLTSAGLVCLSGCVIFSFHHINFGLASIGMRLRIAASSLMYRKITRLNQKSLGQTAAGQVINLLSNDVNRFDISIPPLHALWIMPFQVTYLTYIIWQQVGISSLAGIISMAIVALPLQGYLAQVLARYRHKVSKKTDKRVKLMNEIVSGIQVIKMYAWEKPFERMIQLARYAEIKDIKVASYIRGVFNGCVVFLERLALCLTIVCYVLLGNRIKPEIVFSLAQSFNILQFAMAIMYPMAISLGAEALISVKRIQEFLLLEERETLSINEMKENGVILSGVSASWTETGSILNDITLQVPPGTLCAIVGPVGSGKSSILQLLLGELIPSKGKIQMGGKVSYSSQNPWLFQSTVRNNILFGQPYNKIWYDKIVKVCALERDFEQFPHRDHTIVGERGVSLSGGQRARINLARAIYREADIYLMDDPLSAVDTHVGKHLFEQCINKHLRGKTRILVTHQLQYLKKANLIVVINNGKIESQGTFEELIESKLDFTKLLVDSDETVVEKTEDIQETETMLSLIAKRKGSTISAISGISESIEFSQQHQEEEAGNDPKSKPFKNYLLATRNICLLVFLISLMIVAQAICAGADFWVAFWTAQEELRYAPNSTILHSEPDPSLDIYHLDQGNSTDLTNTKYDSDLISRTPVLGVETDNFFDFVQADDGLHKLIKTDYAMYLYGFIIITAVILTIGRSFVFYKTCMISSVNLHSTIFHTLLKAPMRFFDTNPSGRVLNRFSKDMGAIDEVLPRVLMDAFGIVLVMCGILVNVSVSNPYIIIAIIILGAIFIKFRSWYISTAKIVKHLEGIAKSPVFSHVNSTLNGIITIRASKAEDILIDEFDHHQDVHTSAWYLLLSCMNSFGLWLDILCLIFTATVTFSFVFLDGISKVNGNLVGLAISQSMILTGMLQHGMRQTAEVVNQLTSVERVLQYTSIDQEGPFETPKDMIPKDEWPKDGLIEFKNLTLNYVEDDPPVLKDLNFTLYPGEKIGIVGRTGAGKSSLIAALFRLAPLDGAIFIDGVDTKTFGLNDLRKKISIIPQEPVLFSATLRYNLDPFGEFEDDQIWKALEQVELKDAVDSLDFMVAEGGGNFSLGQRQLVCLARAALRNNKILVMDEATANVDHRWMIGLIRQGSKNNIELKTLYKALDRDKSEKLGDRLEKYWFAELLKAEKRKIKPSFLKAIVRTFYVEFMMYGLLWFLSFGVLSTMQPVILQRLIVLFTATRSEDKSTEMYMYSAILVGLIFFSILLFHHANYGMARLGMRIRIAASSLVYRKITRLNQKSLGQTAAGQVINLLSNDVNRFDLAVLQLHAIWVMPIQTVAMGFFMWEQVGLSCLAGFISMAIISLPLQGYLATVLGKLRSMVSKKTDRRVKLMTEILAGIQVIKMYAWEKPFEKVVKFTRCSEIKDISKTSYIRGIYASCMVFNDRLSLCLTIICFILLGNRITADKVFSMSQGYNILQMIMAIYFPMALSLGAECLVSIKRLQQFLVMEERQQTDSIEYVKKSGIVLSRVNASWTNTESTLHDICLEIPPGTLCAVVGPVGAGKSSLLQLLLEELLPKSGTIQVGGEISYCSQEPWLFQSTVRNNILFGRPYEKSWYEKVVKVCALKRDYDQFPQGDKTIVGERGVSLSGGQRARINLARAIYRQADIYLLDDPLSAVDTHVGKHLFEECINKHLRSKIRILVTHQLQYLKKANLIVVINEGKIEAQGTFEELSNMKLDFTKLLVDANEFSEKHEENDGDTECSIKLRKPSAISIASTISEAFTDYIVNEEESGKNPDSKPLLGYILATRKMFVVVLTALVLVLAQGFCAGTDFWVAYWTGHEGIRNSNPPQNLRSPSTHEISIVPLNNSIINNNYSVFSYTSDVQNARLNSFSTSDMYDNVEVNGIIQRIIKTDYGMIIYGSLIGLAVVLTVTRSLMFYKMCMSSSVNLHTDIFHALLQAPMRFFDTNPSGRVLNRFSKDMGAIDEILPRVLLESFQIFLVTCGILVNVGISNPYLIIAMALLILTFLRFTFLYIASAKSLKHIEGITKSPVFSHVNCTLNGITTIRASRAEDILVDEFDDHQDVHSAAWFLTISTTTAFGLWLDLICVVFAAVVIFGFAILYTLIEVDGSFIGLAISQSIILTGMMQYGMRQTAEVVNQLTSVDRVLQYTTIEGEGPFDTPKENIPIEEWPAKGLLEFKKLSLKYVPTDPPVLNNLNLTISPGQKIGIVGRTGAGKSSLIAALFRLAPLEGSIVIDGVDTKEIGLSDLRKKISIIPQEPILFSASLRYNLDPFEEYDDDRLWKVLEQVDLKDNVDSLDFMVSEGGANFSLGQRQLVCLARAALRNNKILVLDEATANVDHRTDAFIQQTIRERFEDCTVLTIAHRLNTIMDSDKVLVMSFGNMVEFDHPHKLLQIPDGHFHKMVLETGPAMTEQLKAVAFQAYSQNINENEDLVE